MHAFRSLTSANFLTITLALVFLSCQRKQNEDRTLLKDTPKQITCTKTDLREHRQLEKRAFEVNYQDLSLMSGRFKAKVPQDILPMNDKFFELKYPLENRNTTSAFGNADGTVSLLVSVRPEKATQADLTELKLTYTERFRNNPSIEVIKSEITKINGTEFFVLEMITPAVDTRIFNKIMMTVSGGHLLISTLNCTTGEMNKWRPLFEKISDSIVIDD